MPALPDPADGAPRGPADAHEPGVNEAQADAKPGRRIVSISVGVAKPLRALGGRTVLSGIAKKPVPGPVAVRALGLAGDEQADLEAHGGLRKAVYAYPQEHLPFWAGERRTRGLAPFDAPLTPGFVGENLLLAGLLEADLWIGDTLHFDDSDCVLRVTQPREPCYKFCAVMGYAQAAQVMARTLRTGFYLAVDAPGDLQTGMAFRVESRGGGLPVVEAIRAKWAKQRNW